MRIRVTLDSASATAELDANAAPNTCTALASILPYEGVAHYAKVAGEEFLVHLPLALDTEQGKSVMDLSAGAVVFWPERQLLCVYYGRIQQEDATVTLLGRIIENLDGLVDAAERLRCSQGQRYTHVHLELPGDAASAPEPKRAALHPPNDLVDTIMTAYAQNIRNLPSNVERLLARRGVMRPGGALLYAEAETRKLHELLWLIRNLARRNDALPDFSPELLNHFVQRLRGWYGLNEAADLVSEVISALNTLPLDQAIVTVEALAIYVGQLNLWLDAHIPWNDFNELVRSDS